MHIPAFYWTAIVAALLTAVYLKFIHVFHFVSWSPIGWAQYWTILPKYSWAIKWFLLIVMLFLLFSVLYWGAVMTTRIPPAATSIVIALLLVCAVEWSITRPETIKSAVGSVSIPFLCLSAILVRFVVGTAVYMQEENEAKAK